MKNGKIGSWFVDDWHVWSLVATWESYIFSPSSLVKLQKWPLLLHKPTGPLLLFPKPKPNPNPFHKPNPKAQSTISPAHFPFLIKKKITPVKLPFDRLLPPNTQRKTRAVSPPSSHLFHQEPPQLIHPTKLSHHNKFPTTTPTRPTYIGRFIFWREITIRS